MTRPALACLAALCMLVMIPRAQAVDVSQLSDFEADPCVMALGERNTAKHVDAPDSALVDSCDRAHGNVEVAWDFLTRTWLPRDVAATATYAAAATPLGMSAALLAAVEMLLAYVVLGTPVWAVVVALRPATSQQRPRRLAAQAALSLCARVLLGTILLTLLNVPLAKVLAALLVLAAIVRLARAVPRRTADLASDAPRPSAVAEIVAGSINDTAAAAAGLLALSLVARGQWRLLVFGVLLSILFALPPVLRGLRIIRQIPAAPAAAGTLLALGAGSLALTDPVLARAVALGGGVPAYLVPLAFAAVVIWRYGLLDRIRPGRRQLSGG